MSDIFLKKFYNDIKDDSWPLINTYCDFLKLPEHIRNECINDHNMNQRLEQIESHSYWQKILPNVYYYENLAFLPVLKCGSLYYIDLFENQLGWKKCKFSDLAPGTVCFGFFEEPTTRYLKGITEWIWWNILPLVNNDITKIPTTLLETVIIGDPHSVPYTMCYGHSLEKINCIPMHQTTNEQQMQYLTTLFKTQNHNIKLPTTENRLHTSDELKLKLYNLIRQVFENYLPEKEEYLHRGEFTYLFLSQDLKFYRNLLNTFDPTWQKIKFIT